MKKSSRNTRAAGAVFALLLFASGLLSAQDKRSLPVDFYLIVDGSSRLTDGKNETLAWINSQVIDGILQEGDTLTIWSAGDKAQVVYSGAVDADKGGVTETLKNLETSGKSADFTGALRETISRAAGSREAKRLPVTMVVSSSAEALAPSLGGGSGGLLRWSRVEEYARWQVLIAAPGIGDQVSRAAAAYMSGR